MADATVAAEALTAAGAEEVLLFGSVARGDAHNGSDIDLVALFADIDYSQRRAIRQRLEAAAASVTRWTTQVIVTDRPEWRRRVDEVPAAPRRNCDIGVGGLLPRARGDRAQESVTWVV
jgi:predicted nucleotidyltransferase